jgi:hypothetical protein
MRKEDWDHISISLHAAFHLQKSRWQKPIQGHVSEYEASPSIKLHAAIHMHQERLKMIQQLQALTIEQLSRLHVP